MKNACLYLLIIITTAYSTGLHELAKAPAFIRHYKEHRANHSAAGLGEFLSMHYLGKDKNDNDAEKDKALPFKQQQRKLSPLFEPAPLTGITPLPFLYTIARNITPYRGIFWPKGITLACFRPPCAAYC